MKMPGTRSKKHIDQDKLREQIQVKNDLRTLLETGDEDGYVAMLKALRPTLTPEDLVSLVERFRAERRNQTRGA